MGDFVYELKDSLYLNITNRCNNSCTFCIKYKKRCFENKYNLWLEKEPSSKEIIESIKNPKQYSQIVFCGYGEPLIRLETVKEIAKYFHEKGIYIRVDTDGQANLFHQRNIIPELSQIVDEIIISLNAQDKETYNKLCRPLFKDKTFSAAKEFAKEAKRVIPNVFVSFVDLPSVNKEKIQQIADEIGVELKIRPYYKEKYEG